MKKEEMLKAKEKRIDIPTWMQTLSIQFSSVAQFCLILQPHGLPVHHQLLEFFKLRSIESVTPANHLICCHLFPYLQSFLASGSFQISQFFISDGQSNGVSASSSASVLPINIQDWFPLSLTGLISLQAKVLSRVFSNTTVQKH